MNAVLQFGAGYRTYIIAAVLALVVVVEMGLGIDVPGVDVGSDWLTHVLAALGLGTCHCRVNYPQKCRSKIPQCGCSVRRGALRILRWSSAWPVAPD